MAVRSCRVRLRDAQGVEHSVQVSAQSLYEAVAQALRVFRENEWAEPMEHSGAALVINIREPEVEHRVRIEDFRNWLKSGAKSPAEMALKSRLRNILDR